MVGVAGQLDASWNGDSGGAFVVDALTAVTASVRDASGANVRSGGVAFASADLSGTAVAVTGNNAYSITGSGSLSFYGPSESSLGVSGNWDSYSASITGNVSLTITTDSLAVNGTTLPAGTYTITAPSATLVRQWADHVPNFSGSASITTTNGTVNLGPGSGNVTVGGSALDPTNGATLTGYTGSIAVAAGGGTTWTMSRSTATPPTC